MFYKKIYCGLFARSIKTTVKYWIKKIISGNLIKKTGWLLPGEWLIVAFFKVKSILKAMRVYSF